MRRSRRSSGAGETSTARPRGTTTRRPGPPSSRRRRGSRAAATSPLATVVGGLLLVTDAATARRPVPARRAGPPGRGRGAALLRQPRLGHRDRPLSPVRQRRDSLSSPCHPRRTPPSRRKGRRRRRAVRLAPRQARDGLLPAALRGAGPGAGASDASRPPLPYAVFAASFLPFWKSWPAIRENVVGYRGGTEAYGVGAAAGDSGRPVLAAGGPLSRGGCGRDLHRPEARARLRRPAALPRHASLHARDQRVLPGLADRPGSLFGGAGYAVYTLVTAGFLIGGSLEGLGIENAHFPGWHGVWWSLVFWAAWDARRRSILSRQ